MQINAYPSQCSFCVYAIGNPNTHTICQFCREVTIGKIVWYKHVFMGDSVELLDKYIVFTEFDAIDASEPLLSNRSNAIIPRSPSPNIGERLH